MLCAIMPKRPNRSNGRRNGVTIFRLVIWRQRCRCLLPPSSEIVLAILLIYAISSSSSSTSSSSSSFSSGQALDKSAPAIHKHLCLEDDYTNDLPIFIERQTICNFDSAPIQVYTIKTMPDSAENKFCLKGNYWLHSLSRTRPPPDIGRPRVITLNQSVKMIDLIRL